MFEDGAGPDNPLPPEDQPTSFYNETACTNANEFPDKNMAAERRALQIILNVEGWDKPSFEASVDIQAKFYQSLSDNIAALGFGDVCMRVFNVDNSYHGAGVKTRVWFQTQADCIGYANYIYNTVMQFSALGFTGVFRDINYLSNNQFDPSVFGLAGETTGGVTVRMMTNPQSRCHKWNLPSASVCSSQLAYFQAGTTTAPTSPIPRDNNSEVRMIGVDPVVIHSTRLHCPVLSVGPSRLQCKLTRLLRSIFFSQLCPNEETAPVRDESKPPAMITAASMWDVKHGNRLGHRVGRPRACSPPTHAPISRVRPHCFRVFLKDQTPILAIRSSFR